MLSEKENTRISKFLSLVLRHQPQFIGIVLDENGWTDVDILIQKAVASGMGLDLPALKHVVETNSKKRFAFDESGLRIRASQGHSLEVELAYEAKEPPEILFHGTAVQSVESILQTGLDKRKRHHVHLSANYDTAIQVGMRHGKPAVLDVMAGQMYKDGFQFFLSANGVWLTDDVPVKYMRLRNDLPRD